MEWVALAALATIVALVFLLRGPIAEWRVRRRAREQERKRATRRQRETERQKRRVERAMNPVRAAARKGEPRWQQVAQRHGGKCWLCGKRTYADDRRRLDVGSEQLGATFPTVDYVVPIADGGTYAMDNLRIAHQVCRERRQVNPGTRYTAPKRTFSP